MSQITISLSGTEDAFARFVGSLQSDGAAAVEVIRERDPVVVVTFTAGTESEDDDGRLLAEVSHG